MPQAVVNHVGFGRGTRAASRGEELRDREPTLGDVRIERPVWVKPSAGMRCMPLIRSRCASGGELRNLVRADAQLVFCLQ